jgi:guanylate kinase
MIQGVVLYGPPASGKDTVTNALTTIDPRYRLFERLKVGPGRTSGYRVTSNDELEALAVAGEIVWENRRYGSRYAIDRTTLRTMIADGQIPVVHAGQPEVVTAVRQAIPGRWCVVQLWTSREVAATRIAERQTGDSAARLEAWDATPHLTDADLDLDTASLSPERAASLIKAIVSE